MYIATFYTHYGAQAFHHALRAEGAAAELMPVPRALSAACGICVSFSEDRRADIRTVPPEDLEALYAVREDGGYETLLELD